MIRHRSITQVPPILYMYLAAMAAMSALMISYVQ